VTYTQNWPHEPLVGNQPTGGAVVWSVISFVLLLGGIGGMVWYFGSQPRALAEDLLPERDPLLGLKPTPSQRATVKFFFVVAALWVVQVGLGALTAHYGVEGSGFYGVPLDRWLPYSVTRTWHLQIGLFWIATAWLAQVELFRRVAAYDQAKVLRTAREHPDDPQAQAAAADVELATGHIEAGFDRLLGVIARTSGEERNKARLHLLALFEILSPKDQRVTKARAKLSSLLF
jgi:hypothetical protein